MGAVLTDSSESLKLAAAVLIPVNSSLSSLLHYIHTGRHGGGGGGGGIAMEEGERGGDRDGERERRGKEREKSKTLFYKDCSSGSVKKPNN